MKEPTIKFKAVMLMGVLFCIGCTTKPPVVAEDDDVIIPPNLYEKDINKEAMKRGISYSDPNFKAVIKEDGCEDEFVANADNAPNILDLAAFWGAVYYQDISPKLKSGQKLTDADLRILNYVCDSQLAALQTFASYGYTSLIGTNLTYYAPAIINYDLEPKTSVVDNYKAQHDGQIANAIQNFIQAPGGKKDPYKRKIDAWTANFSQVPPELHDMMLREIASGKARWVDDVNWRNYYAPVAIPVLVGTATGGVIGGVIVGTSAYQAVRHYEIARFWKNYLNYNVDKNTACYQWESLVSSFDYYIGYLKDIYDDTGAYLRAPQDSYSKRKIEAFRLNMRESMLHTASRYRQIYYDFAFSFACANAYAHVRNAKGIFNDDEKKMIQEIYNFVSVTCGTKMISKLSSPYSAHLYQELQKTLKTELAAEEYENAKTASRFFDNVNLLDFSTPASLFSSHNVGSSNKSAQQ